MIDRTAAEQALEHLSVAISDILEETHPVTVERVIGSDVGREDLILQAGEDILILARAMQVFRRRGGAAEWGRAHD